MLENGYTLVGRQDDEPVGPPIGLPPAHFELPECPRNVLVWPVHTVAIFTSTEAGLVDVPSLALALLDKRRPQCTGPEILSSSP